MMSFSKIEKKSPAQLELEQQAYYKDLVQDVYNEFSTFERLIDFKGMSDEIFFEKIQSYNLKTFEEYNNSRNKNFDESLVNKYYPGFIKNFDNIVEKIKSNQLGRSEIKPLIEHLYNLTNKPLPNIKEIERELLKENKESIAA